MHLLDESRIEVGRAAERDVVFVTVNGQWIYFNILAYIADQMERPLSTFSVFFLLFPKTALPRLDDDIGYSLMNQEKNYSSCWSFVSFNIIFAIYDRLIQSFVFRLYFSVNDNCLF